MNEILELIEKARVELPCNDSYCQEVMENLVLLVGAKHKADVIAAFNRGRVSMMGMGAEIDPEKYYELTYGEN